MRAFSILLLAMLLAASTAACGEQACTEIGCMDSLTFQLPDSDEWPGSAVEICVGDMCGSVESVGADFQQMTGPLAGDVRLDGTDLVWIGSPEHLDYEAPVSLAVSSEFGGAGTRFDPTWETDRPNGPGCPPVCRTAVVEVSG